MSSYTPAIMLDSQHKSQKFRICATRPKHKSTRYYNPTSDYYFDVTVAGATRNWHSLLPSPADANSVVIDNV